MRKCNLCGSKSFQFLFRCEDANYGLPGSFNILRCRHCSLIFLDPIPKNLDAAYPKTYYSFTGSSRTSKLTKLFFETYYGGRNSILKFLLWPLKPLMRGAVVVRGGRLLDVGCGSGAFLHLMKSFEMDVVGVEVGLEGFKSAKKSGLKVYNSLLEKIKFPSNHFDVVTANHVLEHVTDPKSLLKEMKRILKPNGTLIIGVPNTDSFAFKLFGKNWIHLDVPRHLYDFSVDNLKGYANELGLSIKRVRHKGASDQYTAAIEVFLNKFRKRKVLLSESRILRNKFLVFLFLPLAVITNLFHQGDAVEIYFTKN